MSTPWMPTCRTQVGRFGLGFSSVYHITDVPSFVTNGSLVWCDPHKAFANPDREGLRIDYCEENGFADEFTDQVAPFQGFQECCFGAPYPGKVVRSARNLHVKRD